jgi:hypothetical protein
MTLSLLLRQLHVNASSHIECECKTHFHHLPTCTHHHTTKFKLYQHTITMVNGPFASSPSPEGSLSPEDKPRDVSTKSKTQKQKRAPNPAINWKLSPRTFTPANRVRLMVELLTSAKTTVMEMPGLPEWKKITRTVMYSHYYFALSEVATALEAFTAKELNDKTKYDFGDSQKTLRQMAAKVDQLMAPLQLNGSSTQESVKEADSCKRWFESIFQKIHITCLPVGRYVNADMVNHTGSIVFASLDCEERLLLRCVTGEFVRFHEVDRFHGETRAEIERECRKRYQELKVSSCRSEILCPILNKHPVPPGSVSCRASR